MLDARGKLWDDLNARAIKISLTAGASKGSDATSLYEGDGEESDVLYDKQAERWVRDKPNCLSDFTGRPRLFEAAGDVTDKSILDVGCGEGYVARHLRRSGAGKVVGVDISDGMIKAAQGAESRQNLGGLTYATGSSTDLALTLVNNKDELGLTPAAKDAPTAHGNFDMSVAVFLFNYLSVAEMQNTMLQVYQLLKPGGAFVFSVPHPMMAGQHHTAGNAEFGFGGDGSYSGYFSSRDVSLPGVITKKDGTKLNVRMVHKTIEDYVSSIRKIGFALDRMIECTVTETHLKEDPSFFMPLKDLPLHIVFRVIKPEAVALPAAPADAAFELPSGLVVLHLATAALAFVLGAAIMRFTAAPEKSAPSRKGSFANTKDLVNDLITPDTHSAM